MDRLNDKKKVIVLTDDTKKDYNSTSGGKYNSPFLRSIVPEGRFDYVMYLCRMPSEVEMKAYQDEQASKSFMIEVFDIRNNNQKLLDLMSSKDGIIMIFNHTNLDEEIYNRMKYIVKHAGDRPTLVIIERTTDHRHIVEPTGQLKEFISVPHRNAYGIDYNKNKIYCCKKPMIEPTKWFTECLNRSTYKYTQSLTSRTISDSLLMKEFENNTLDMNLWDHYGRLRMVYLSLKKFGYAESIKKDSWLCRNWKRYKESIGHGHLWHYTLTRFWLEILHYLDITSNKTIFIKENSYSTIVHNDSFNHIYSSHPEIHTGRYFETYYTKNVLFTDLARNSWIEPNLKSLPKVK
jgi:hypothetical protein